MERRLTTDHPGERDDERGLAAFAQAGIAAAPFNRIDRYVGGGLVYTGLAGAQGTASG